MQSQTTSFSTNLIHHILLEMFSVYTYLSELTQEKNLSGTKPFPILHSKSFIVFVDKFETFVQKCFKSFSSCFFGFDWRKYFWWRGVSKTKLLYPSKSKFLIIGDTFFIFQNFYFRPITCWDSSSSPSSAQCMKSIVVSNLWDVCQSNLAPGTRRRWPRNWTAGRLWWPGSRTLPPLWSTPNHPRGSTWYLSSNGYLRGSNGHGLSLKSRKYFFFIRIYIFLTLLLKDHEEWFA